MFSIVIPLYNKQNCIEKTISSVLNQSYSNYEIIVINDGSTDNSLEVVKSISDPRLKIISQENSGVSSARNRGIRESKNKYIAFLDADDHWDENYLSKLSEVILKHKGYGLYGARQFLELPNGTISKSRIGNLVENNVYVYDNYFEKKERALLFHTSAVIISRELVIKGNIYFNENLVRGEDLDFFFRIALKSGVVFLSKALTYYLIDAENSAMNKPTEISKRLIGNISSYKTAMENNIHFKNFIHSYILSCWGLLLIENESKVNIKNVISNLTFSDLSLKQKIYYLMPNYIKRIISTLKQRI